MPEQQTIFGLHPVTQMLTRNPTRILTLYVAESRENKGLHQILKAARENKIKIEHVDRQTLDKLTDGGNHQGVAARALVLETLHEADLPAFLDCLDHVPLLLILDGVQDPHNLGACFRSADASGTDAIITTKDRAVGLTPVVAKVASGAIETVPFFQVTNLARTLEMLKGKGIWVYGADSEAKCNLFQANFKVPTAIVLGAEGKGLRRLTRETCDELVSIPMRGIVESLNVSVAAGIFLFEVVRQRH